MRAVALVAGLLMATPLVAAAAPVSGSDLMPVMRHLGMDGIGHATSESLIGFTPGLKALDGDQRACAAGELATLLDAHMSTQIAGTFGEEGSDLLAEWTRFMPTPAGVDMGRTFRASAQVQAGIATATPQVSAAHKEAIAAFMQGEAFQRFIGGLSAESPVPEDIGERMAEALKSGCQIDFDPGQMS